MDGPFFRRILVPLELLPADRQEPDTVEVGGRFIVIPSAVRKCIESSVSFARGGTICLLHATPVAVDVEFVGISEGGSMPVAGLSDLDAQARESAEHTLRDIARRFIRTANYEIHVSSGAAAEVILRHARTSGADLIILATSGRSRAQRFFLGSTTDKIIRQASCPVFVIPHDQEA